MKIGFHDINGLYSNSYTSKTSAPLLHYILSLALLHVFFFFVTIILPILPMSVCDCFTISSELASFSLVKSHLVKLRHAIYHSSRKMALTDFIPREHPRYLLIFSLSQASFSPVSLNANGIVDYSYKIVNKIIVSCCHDV